MEPKGKPRSSDSKSLALLSLYDPGYRDRAVPLIGQNSISLRFLAPDLIFQSFKLRTSSFHSWDVTSEEMRGYLISHSAYGCHCHNGQSDKYSAIGYGSICFPWPLVYNLVFVLFCMRYLLCVYLSCSVGKEISKHRAVTLGLHKLPGQVLPVVLTHSE